jgi:uncharacterized protein (TIGR03546 family)
LGIRPCVLDFLRACRSSVFNRDEPDKAFGWSRRRDSNSQPLVYKTSALPLSYAGAPRQNWSEEDSNSVPRRNGIATHFHHLAPVALRPTSSTIANPPREAFPVWLTLFKFTRWLYQTLNSDVAPWQVGLGFTLGALAGLLPPGLGTVCVFTAIILINVHFGSALFVFGVFRLVGWALEGPLVRPVGASALELVPQAPLIAAAQTPVVSWLRLDYHDVAGAIAIWLMIAIPMFAGMTLFWRRYRPMLEKKLKNSRLMQWASQVWLFRGLKYVFLG